MTWTLFSSTRSPFVRKVLIAAHEAGLDRRIRRQDVVTTPMRAAPEVTAHNPLGMIPTLVTEDGEMLHDSLVILDFLQETAGQVLIPAQGAARRDCLTRHAIANGIMDKAVKMLDETFRVQNDDTRDHLQGYATSIRAALGWMENRLEPGRFDAGDIALAAGVSYLDMRFPHLLWRDAAPGVARWYGDILLRPSMEATDYEPAAVLARP